MIEEGAPIGDERASPESDAVSAKPKWVDLGPRLASAAVLVIVALITLWRGDGVFVMFWLLASFGVLWEWQSLVGGRGLSARLGIGGAALAFAANFVTNASFDEALGILLLGAGASALAAEPTRRLWSAAGVVYAGSLIVSLCLLRFSIFDGARAVLWLFAVVWGSDVMAYFGGRALGGPRLWPRVSPGKTWSGLATGVLCGSLLGLIAVHFAGGSERALPLLGLGILASIVAQGGDLFESAMKRRFGAKDSGRLIPGHGGLMDRLDGFIAASAFAAIVGAMRYDAASAALGLLRW